MDTKDLVTMKDVLHYLLEQDGGWLDQKVKVDLLSGDTLINGFTSIMRVELLDKGFFFPEFT